MNKEKKSSCKIHCLGGALADLIVRTVKEYPKPKLHTSIFVDNFSYSAGGGAVNTSLALGKLGLDVGIFSKIGDDIFGQMIKNVLSDNNVDIKNLVRTKTNHTSTVIVGVHEDADRSFISYHGALSEYSENDFVLEDLFDSSFLLCSDFFNLPKIDGTPMSLLLENAQKSGVTTLLDATWGVLGLRQDMLEEVLPFVDYFLPSVDECRLMYPNKTDEQLIEYFLSKGCKSIVLKRGSKGIIASDGDTIHKVSALKVNHEIVDTTGAGDNFNAGFLYGLVYNYGFEKCLKAGVVCARYSLLDMGAWYSAEEIREEMKKHFGE